MDEKKSMDKLGGLPEVELNEANLDKVSGGGISCYYRRDVMEDEGIKTVGYLYEEEDEYSGSISETHFMEKAAFEKHMKEKRDVIQFYHGCTKLAAPAAPAAPAVTPKVRVTTIEKF